MEQEAGRPATDLPADGGTRGVPRNPIFALALVACIGSILLALASIHQERIVGWVIDDPDQVRTRLRLLLALLAVIGVLPVALMGFFAGRMSMAVTRSGRYPPPGVQLRRTEAVREGAEAESAARTLRIVSIVLVAISLAIPVLFFMIASSLTPQ